MEDNNTKKQFSVYLDEEVYKKLIALAKKDDRSLVSYVRNLLNKHVEDTH